MFKLGIMCAFVSRFIPAAVAAVMLTATPTRAADPIKIGFSMALTGPLASGGKVMLIALKIWEEDVNARGGLLGRPVQLVYYDDQSNGSQVPGIYTKLLDIDKVDLVVSSYGTNVAAPAMPIVMQRNKLFLSMFSIGLNTEFKYLRYFSILPAGPNPKTRRRRRSDRHLRPAMGLRLRANSRAIDHRYQQPR
jgi:branched-chain amino acid transport system substrate-binding protein